MIKEDADAVLKEMEAYRMRIINKNEPSDHVIRVCEAIVASRAGYQDRMAWAQLQGQA